MISTAIVKNQNSRRRAVFVTKFPRNGLTNIDDFYCLYSVGLRLRRKILYSDVLVNYKFQIGEE